MGVQSMPSGFEMIQDEIVIDRIIEAASNLSFDEFQSLSKADDIAGLSSNTQLEGLEISPDGVLKVNDDEFEASATVYLTLQYGGSRDTVSIPDSYPAVVRGNIGGASVEITEIRVDTGSFYE